MRTAVFLALLMVAAATPAATTYRWVDDDGVHYSDQPHPGAEIVTLGKPQTYTPARSPPGGATPARPLRPGASEATFRYDSCAIVQPADDQVLFEGESVKITVQLRPAKRSADRVVLSFDGKPIEPANADQVEFPISPIDRGTHMVAASVRDEAGKSYCQSPQVTFHVRQPSVLAPQYPGKRH
jgi:hypothetical protein